ncbi:AF4/FMR2 family member 4 isoform X3 [Drosophila busckii]|uniref:AF4/FMR2 family member 4 isoform X3 n=1 Tax=Drosophila busckii TaxID=30019 RepID=UPI00083EF5A7|nr:AF4/FMR2 family member 4 isoform X3 [Drosophila busckii]
MDLSLERDSSALGSLFQQIINDMKNTSPLWEDFVAKASKLHTCLRAAIQAIAAYLDAFQKIADAATNSRGASKEIGTALTRVCLRHKAVETRLKSFTGAIMDCLVQPLQDKIEDWKRTVATIDKDHAKEHKRCRTELKKRSSDTLRLQKKARKGQTDNSLQSLMDSHMQDVTLRRAELEDVEKKSLRAAMIEERLRYCSFVHMLQPVVHEECEVMSELGHLQEAMQSIALVTKEPSVLPQASEELIHVAKASINLYPESPGGGSGSQGGGCSNSLGSRKSSVCSISSMNSSGSSNSPGHHHYQRSLSQFVTPAIRLKPGESSDSGFCSSPALTTQATNASNQTHAVATWPPHSQDVVDTLPPTADRPHTISTTYEKGHQRPPLTVYTFQNPETIHESSSSNSLVPTGNSSSGQNTPATQKSPAATLSRPPLPVRCSSLERPLSAQSNHRQNSAQNLLQRQCPSPIPAHITKELSAAHHAQQQSQPQQQQQQQPAPTYVNTCELAAMKLTQQQQQQSTPLLQQQSSIDSISSQHSNDSSTSSLQQQLLLHQQHQQQQQQQQHMNHQQPRSHSISSASSHTASSLHSHASLDSAVATAGGGAAAGYTNTSTTTPSSGCSTPQNHYSPLLTNSPTSTAAGTPSGGSIASGLGFVYQISSPTPPPSAHEPLKITESTATVDSAEADERSRASVLQKASMFEKQAAATTAPNNVPRRSEEIRVAEQQEMDKSFEDSIQALNNLIGELDSFQREIDEGKGKQQQQHNNNNSSSNSNSGASSNNSNQELLLLPTTIDSISNQTNSSGCGTDISDTTSEELEQQHQQQQQLAASSSRLGASDSELSRCYVSETSSLTAGYENPTFAHFAAQREDGSEGRSLYADSVSLAASDTVCQQRHAYVDSDSGSAVVVIYDHQIPNTPDIEFVKQNSEIVLLRTKDPQQLQLHEMRELQQLPDNLAGSPESPDGATGTSSSSSAPRAATATVAPAKQRLSSFRASSEQQLQLLGRASPHRGTVRPSLEQQQQPQQQQQQQQQQPQQQQLIASDSNGLRLKLPPKPSSLSIFNANTLDTSNSSSSSNSSSKPVIPRKFDFKADLDAKIRQQKLKVQQQLQQQQQSNSQQQLPAHSPTTTTTQSPPTTTATTPTTTTTSINCNVINKPDAIACASAIAASLSQIHLHRMPKPNQTSATYNHAPYKTPTTTATTTTTTPAAKLSLLSSSTSSSSSPTSSTITAAISAALLPAMPQLPARATPTPAATNSNNTITSNSFMCSNANANANAHAQVKPCITPRPASLSGGAGAGAAAALGGSSTRIARRSSINQAKPPPPVRRSSSVTPSPNNSNLLQHQQQMLSNSSEHLPPPPAFMLEAATATYNTTATTATDMPSSALRVSETVRALAALRHQPASPVALRRLQQQQQQHTQQQQQQRAPSLQTTPHTQSLHQSPATSAELDYEAYYNSYMQLHAYANSQQQQQQQQLHYQQQQQPPTPPPYQAPPPADGSFRTSSPSAGGIYAQPKLMSNMSSFRTSSPSPNGHGHAHALPPTQPKANPNLIAQLNARINSKQQQQQQHQQQQHVAEGIYGNAGDNIYMRGGLSMTQQQQQQHIDAAAQQAAQRQQQQQQQQQQQHYTCPPPLEDPPPPPIYSATMPKKMSRAHAAYSSNNSNHHGNSNNSSSSNMSNHMASAYAAASASATLPKNMLHQQQQQQQQQQQRLLQQQQQQQYHQPAGVGNGHANQRSQMPLPQQQQQQLQQRQPPIPSRHSSVQQKIFVSTNPFIQTTAVKFHSPSSVHSTPAASPTCGSLAAAASLASIYGTTARGGGAAAASQQYHQQQQQQQQHYYRDVAGGNNSNGGSVYYASHNNAHAHAHAHTPHMPHVQAQAHHSNYAASTNIEKTGNIRAKTKAEFLENLNAKLAKQGMSGRAFAVRNLINSKALPDPRICHESLMDQIKRGAPLKRNQKINDRSAPKIH